MISEAAWLGLETKSLAPARRFYQDHLGLPLVSETADTVAFTAGTSRLVLRTPGPVPRGGLHTHFAFTVPSRAIDTWRDRLNDRFDLAEHQFGESRSLYCYDPEGNCVELGGRGEGSDTAVQDIFEVVLEVENLDRATSFYRTLGFDIVDRGSERRRIRLTAGQLDLELWEPQLGIAEARGGVHVDLGLTVDDPKSAADRVADQSLETRSDGTAQLVRDPDGHWMTLVHNPNDRPK